MAAWNRRATLTLCGGLLVFLTGSSAGERGASRVVFQALPEGDGLAARHQRDDPQFRDHPDVVLVDDFEAIAPGALARSRPDDTARPRIVWDNAWGHVTVTREPQQVHGGRQAIGFAVQGPGGAGMTKRLASGFDRLFLRYYIKYDPIFPGAHHVGAALEGFVTDAFNRPGLKADGTNRFTVFLDHWAFETAVRSPGPLVAYVYHMDQQHEWGEQFYPSGKTQPGTNGLRGLFGPSFVPRRDWIPERDRWYAYELMVQVNTPGHRDGRVAFWVDGRLAGDFPNLRFRSVPSLAINHVGFGIYESRRMGPQRVWFDDIVVATSYIGPSGAPSRSSDQLR